MNRTRVACLAVALAVPCFPGLAERKPNSPADAKLIVWGTVEDVVRTETTENNTFKVKIRVENVERGYIRGGGKEIWASCFQRKASAPKIPAASGHKAVPEKGQFIRALLLQPRRGEWEGIYPDWFHVLELTDDQRAALKWVRSVSPGCRLGCDDSLPGRPITSVYLFKMWDSGVTDADMTHVTAFPEMRSVRLYYSRVRQDGVRTLTTLKNLEALTLSHLKGHVTDEDILPLAGTETLQTLDLMNAGVTDAAMKQFAAMPSLRSLRLTGTKVTDQGLEQLTILPQLESLTVYGSKITDRGVEHLSAIPSLKHLSLQSTAISDSSLRMLRKLSLISLDLRDCEVTDDGLQHLAAHKELQELNLQNTSATDAALEQLAGLTELRKLTLQSTQVTDTGFLRLASCPKLKEVWIAKTKITPEGIEKLREALPDCAVNTLLIE